MKFEKVLDKTHDDPHFLVDKPEVENPLDSVLDYKLYDNLAIYIMKPGIKGNFKTLAPIVNNGIIAPSWAIRIYYLNNEWTLHFAPHPNIAITSNLRDDIELLINDPDTKVLGHNHVAMIISLHKTTIENVVNTLITAYQNNKLPSIELQPIDVKYKTEISTVKYKIPVNYKSVEMFDEETYKKYLIIIKRLIDDASIQEIDKNEIIRISKKLFKTKVLNKRDLSQINEYTEKYIDQHSKIKIALQYILSSKNN